MLLRSRFLGGREKSLARNALVLEGSPFGSGETGVGVLAAVLVWVFIRRSLVRRRVLRCANGWGGD